MRARQKKNLCPECSRQREGRIDTQGRLQHLRSTVMYCRKETRDMAKAMEAVAMMFDRELEASRPHLDPF